MATDLTMQSLLGSADRSLRPVLVHWLESKELDRLRDEQLILYLSRVYRTECRAKVLAKLSTDARALLARIVRDEQTLAAGDLMARTAADGHAVSPSALAELHQRGLSFFDDSAWWPSATAAWSVEHLHQYVVAPAGLRDEPLLLDRKPIALPAHAGSVQAAGGREATPTASLLNEFVHACSRGSLRITQQTTLTSRSLDVFARLPKVDNAEVCSPDHVLAFALAAELVRADSTGSILATRKLAAFRQKPGAEQLDLFLNCSAQSLAEPAKLARQFGFGLRRFALETMRTIFAHDPGKAWLSVHSIVGAVACQAAPLFAAASARHPWRWSRSTCSPPARRVWLSLVTSLLDGWFIPAGVLEHGVDGKQARCVRVTPFGIFWLTGDPACLHGGKHSRLVVQTDFTAILTHSGPWDPVAQTLRLFATRSGDDNASTFIFDREHIRQALRHGHAVDELIEMLNRHSVFPVPANVCAILRDWATVSSPAVLYRDVNLFTFSSEDERDKFAADFPRDRVVPMGSLHLLILAAEHQVLTLMQRSGAVPVDYTQPPVAGIEMTADGRITSPILHDLRIRALVDAIAEPVPGTNESQFKLSLARARSHRNPEDILDQILRLPGKPLTLALKLNLLVALGMIEPPPSRRFAIIDHLTDTDRRAMKAAVSWRLALAAQLGKTVYVVDPAWTEIVKTALAAAHSRATLREVELHHLPA